MTGGVRVKHRDEGGHVRGPDPLEVREADCVGEQVAERPVGTIASALSSIASTMAASCVTQQIGSFGAGRKQSDAVEFGIGR